ncbi:MAG: TrmH family RNA methyltransferase [Solirubrobacteraceae bacterium]
MITSPHNPSLKALRKLQHTRERALTGRFVAEGEDLLAAADAAGWTALERYRAQGSGLPGTEVDAEVLASVSSLGSGTRALAVYEQRWHPAPVGPLCVCLMGVGDPGNVGAVLRSALAFGAASVALGPDCADPFSPKAVRASMGAIFEVSVARIEEVGDLPGEKIALVAGAGEVLTGPLKAATLVVGAEREGLTDDAIAACDRTAHIPIASESLNAAMAATVALYEVAPRQSQERTDASVRYGNHPKGTTSGDQGSS